MRGTVKNRNSFLWIAIAILLTGTAARGQASAPSAGAAAQTSDQTPGQASDHASATTATIPVTTHSVTAQRAYEMGMVQREDRLFVDEGLAFFREAVKADPEFALGHAALGYFTTDPKEEKQEIASAEKFIGTASPDEQLLIRWMNGTKNGDLVPAISAMNDLLTKYPNDKRLGNMTAEWLCSNQGAFEHGEAILVRLLKNDPRYFPAMNNLAYCYAMSGQPGLAPAADDGIRCRPAQRAEPAGFLRRDHAHAGRLSGGAGSLPESFGNQSQFQSHRRWALLRPTRSWAIRTKARAQYLVAIKGTKERPTQVNYRILWAMTYYRENKPILAHQAFLKVDSEAHLAGLPIQEAEIHRTVALFSPNPAVALKDLDEAREDLSETRKAKLLSGDRDSGIGVNLANSRVHCRKRGKDRRGAGRTQAAD